MRAMSSHRDERRLSAGLRPDQQVRHISGIDLEALGRRGIRTLLIDFDNTLVARHEVRPSAAVISWLERARELGIEPVIFSNNRSERVKRLAAELSLRCFVGVQKPLPGGYRRVLASLGQTRAEAVAVGDQVFRDVWGANLSGLHSILVEPIDRREFLPIRLIRPLERLVLASFRERSLKRAG